MWGRHSCPPLLAVDSSFKPLVALDVHWSLRKKREGSSKRQQTDQGQLRRTGVSAPHAPLRLASRLFARRSFPRRRGWLLLAFHLRQALLERGHQIHHRSKFLRLFHFGDRAAFKFGLDQLFQILLEGVVILFRIPLRRPALRSTGARLSLPQSLSSTSGAPKPSTFRTSSA